MKKKITILLLSVLALLLIVILGGSVYMLNYSLSPQTRTYAYDWKQLWQMNRPLRPWLDSIGSWRNLPDTTITLQNGLRSHAFYLRHPDSYGRTALVIHGYTRTGINMLNIASVYYRQMGYNILLPDLHGHGSSEGKGVQMGWKDREDMEQWLPVIERMFGAKDIVVHGVSMGAATTMMMSGDELPPSVKCFVEDCGYTSVWDEFSYELESSFGLPEVPLMYSTSVLCKLKNGWSFGEASAIEQVRKCQRPMLFIHGDRDTFVPSWMVHPLYDAKSGKKNLWVTHGCAHAVSYSTYPKEYTQHVQSFVSNYISSPSPSKGGDVSNISASH